MSRDGERSSCAELVSVFWIAPFCFASPDLTGRGRHSSNCNPIPINTQHAQTPATVSLTCLAPLVSHSATSLAALPDRPHQASWLPYHQVSNKPQSEASETAKGSKTGKGTLSIGECSVFNSGNSSQALICGTHSASSNHHHDDDAECSPAGDSMVEVEIADGTAPRRLEMLAAGDRVRVGHDAFSDVHVFSHDLQEVRVVRLQPSHVTPYFRDR